MEKTYWAATYIRTSTQDDAQEHRDSCANQSKLIDRFLRQHPEITLVSEKIDHAYSGLFFDRPAFTELIDQIKSGTVNCIIVKDLSRIGRNYIEVGRYLRDFFPAHNVRLISVEDGIDSTNLDGLDRTIALIKSIFSERYSYDVSVKTRSALDAKRKCGEYVGAIPVYGYQKSNETKNSLTPDPNTLAVVQFIFEMKLEGMSAAGIAAALNQRKELSPLEYKRKHGLSHPTGGFADKDNSSWSPTTIFRILRDETYTGTLIQCRHRRFNYKTRRTHTLDESEWVKVENTHPPIISRQDYDAVQRVLALDTRMAPHEDKVHLFSGLLICGHCGRNLIRKIVKYKDRQYACYYCPTGTSGGCLSSHRVRETDLLAWVISRVKERILSLAALEYGFSADKLQQMMVQDYAQRISNRNAKVRSLHRFQACLPNNLLNSLISDTEYESLLRGYDAEIAQLESEVKRLQKTMQFPARMLQDELAWRQCFLQFGSLEKLDRAAIVRMVQSIHVYSKTERTLHFVY